ncbi:glycosyltransferase [Streptosporangium sp. NPDC051022]|uniref:glycosyltransferase family 2 protein n=1 Tax=Streptosporangium sp. NPDC051022 TaxID=3155752 RepID=UPI00344A0221
MNMPAARVHPATGSPPLIRLNDFGAVIPPELGAWTPRRTVSVVVPSFRCPLLPLTLASLAAQSYPAHLMEVIVVDDGGDSVLRLPEIVPERTRIVPSRPGGWGRAWACQTGVGVAEGEVIHWLDADMVVLREEVEAQMRWHHLADYFTVLGRLKMVSAWGERLSPAEVYAAVSAGTTEKLFEEYGGAGGGAGVENVTDTWSSEYIEQTGDLRWAGLDAFKVHVGASASLPASLLRRAGGMDTSLVLAEDTELGYRLAQAGAVFVADGESRSRHLGASTMMRREQEVKRHNWVFLANRVPHYRWLRKPPARQWEVPYVQVVVTAGDASYEQIRATVDGFLLGTVSDVEVAVVGPWSAIPGGRRPPLDDSYIDLRLVHELYAHDGRVNLVEAVEETPFPTPFRFVCPPGWVPGADCLHRLIRLANEEGYGLVSLALAEHAGATGAGSGAGSGGVVAARLERTAAFNRARLLRDGRRPGDPPGGLKDRENLEDRESLEGFGGLGDLGDLVDLEDLVDATFGTQWLDGETWGLSAMTEEAATPSRSSDRAKVWKKKALRWKRKTVHLQSRIDRTPMRRLRRALRRALGKGLSLAGIRRSRRSRSRGGSRPG